MTSMEIYKKTFKFIWMRALIGVVETLVILGLPIVAFFITKDMETTVTLITSGSALVIAIVAVALFSHYVGYLYRAGQIAMVARGVSRGELPSDPFEEGKNAVKKRFLAVSVFFVIEKIINHIVSQITNAVNKAANKIGGNNDTAKTVGAVVSLFISAMLKYMCACCMGWVFEHPEQNAWRGACDGAIVYFKNWKDLLKNTAKVVAMSLVSLIVVGGVLFGLSYLIIGSMSFIGPFSEAIVEFMAEMEMDVSLTAAQWALVFEGLVALVVWGVLHASFIDPYIMISVMGRYMKAGLSNPPTRDYDSKLAGMSKGFKKAMENAEA